MIVITRRGASTRRAISVVASASVGDTTAPSVKALAHARPSAEWATHATPHMVAATTPIASRRDRAQVRAQVSQPGEERRRVEQRRQDRHQHQVGRQREVRQAGHEPEQQAAADQEDRGRHPGPRGRDEQRTERRQKREQLQFVVCGEVQSA